MTDGKNRQAEGRETERKGDKRKTKGDKKDIEEIRGRQRGDKSPPIDGEKEATYAVGEPLLVEQGPREIQRDPEIPKESQRAWRDRERPR